MAPVVRTLVAADLEEAGVLLRAAYARDAPFEARLARYFALEPDGWFVLEEGGRLAGVVGVLVHQRAQGAVAYLGLMGVAPDRQRRGYASRLMEHAFDHCDRRGVTTIALDASVAGAPLYEGLGFVDRHASVELVFQGSSDVAPPFSLNLGPESCVRPELEAILALDQAGFGADRARAVRALVAAYGDRVVGVQRDGRLVGFVVAQDVLMGPLVAEDDEAAVALVGAALAFRAERTLCPESKVPLFTRLGFREARRLRHMQRGEPWSFSGVYAKGSFVLG